MKLVPLGSQTTPGLNPTPDATLKAPLESMIKKIKMKTLATPGRQLSPEAVNPALEAQEVITEPKNDKVDLIEPTREATEVTKPISPEVAALIKKQRALQLKEQELLAKEKELGGLKDGKMSFDEYRARIKARPLDVLQEEGVTYDQLTEQLLAGTNPTAAIEALEAKIKSQDTEIDKKFQAYEARKQAQDEEAALTEMLYQAEDLAKDGDTYELIRSQDAFKDVLSLIRNTYHKTGRILDVSEAMNRVENQILEKAVKIAQAKKVQSKLLPTTPPQQQAVSQDRPGVRPIRTLTNRDGSTAKMSRYERAIAAFENRPIK